MRKNIPPVHLSKLCKMTVLGVGLDVTERMPLFSAGRTMP